MQEQERVTIVGAVYNTVNMNGDAFQRQVEQKQREEKRVEQAQRTREILQPTPTKDVVELSAEATERVQEAPEAERTPQAPQKEPSSDPVRGNAIDAIA